VDWVSLGLALLKAASAFLNWIQSRQQFKAGEDSEIAKTALAILDKTQAGKRIMEKINAMSDGELDSLVDDLGRPG
jgi:hypothetical protein